MTLSPCRECGSPVSTDASRCPRCGAHTPTPERQAADAEAARAAIAAWRRSLVRTALWVVAGTAILVALPVIVLTCAGQ